MEVGLEMKISSDRLVDSLWKFSTGRRENGNKKKQKEIKTREEENEKRGKKPGVVKRGRIVKRRKTRSDVKGRK